MTVNIIIIYSFVIQVTSEKTIVYEMLYLQFEIKIIMNIIPTDLFTNILLSFFCPFLQTKKKNQIFRKLVVW